MVSPMVVPRHLMTQKYSVTSGTLLSICRAVILHGAVEEREIMVPNADLLNLRFPGR